MKFRPVEGEFIHADKFSEVDDAANSRFFPIVWRAPLELLQDHTIELLKGGFYPPPPLSSLTHCNFRAKNNRLLALEDTKALFT